jgi:integrase
MGSIRKRPETGLLFIDFHFQGSRIREQTALPDTPANRKRLQKALERIEADIALGIFDYEKTFGKPLPVSAKEEGQGITTREAKAETTPTTRGPLFKDFANQWYAESEISWRRSYQITQRGALDKYLIPMFGDRTVSEITKSDVLAFRADLAKQSGRRTEGATLSPRRINAVMKPLRQILNEAADRLNYLSPFRNIKPMRVKRAEVMPFTMHEVQSLLDTVRQDYRKYLTVRFFTGLRTGEANGLKWKYVDFERRVICVRESIVLGEEDELKTEGSQRDIQMSAVVFDALQSQYAATAKRSDYVFCNLQGKPIDNKNFINRVWNPLLRFLGYPHRKAYQMRHTAATLWLAAGEAPEWIARQLGHTSTEMLFRVYSRYVPNLTRNDGSAIDRLLTHTFIAKEPVKQESPTRPTRKRKESTVANALTNNSTDDSAFTSDTKHSTGNDGLVFPVIWSIPAEKSQPPPANQGRHRRDLAPDHLT